MIRLICLRCVSVLDVSSLQDIASDALWMHLGHAYKTDILLAEKCWMAVPEHTKAVVLVKKKCRANLDIHIPGV